MKKHAQTGFKGLFVIALTLALASGQLFLLVNLAKAATTPAAPTGLHVTVVDGNTISYAWNPVSSAWNPAAGMTRYKITLNMYLSYAAGGSEITQETFNTEYKFLDLQPNTAYVARIMACYGDTCSAYSAVSNIAQTSATAIAPTAPTYTWSNGEWGTCTPSGYQTRNILCKDSAGTNVALTLCDSSTSVKPDSSRICTSTPTPTTAPVTPLNLRADSTTNNSITWKWDTVSNAVTYNFKWAIISTIVPTTLAGIATNQYALTGLNPSTDYWGYVQACNTVGCSAWSNATIVKTLAMNEKPDFTVGEVGVKYFSGSNAGNYYYAIVKNNGGGSGLLSSSVIGVNFKGTQGWIGTTNETTYYSGKQYSQMQNNQEIELVGPSTNQASSGTYLIEVTVDPNNNIDESNENNNVLSKTIVISATVVPATPANLRADSTTTSSINWKWDAVSNAVTYNFKWAKISTIVPTTLAGLVSNQYYLTGLTASTDYWGYVQACNTVGCSEWSSATIVKTLAAGAVNKPDLKIESVEFIPGNPVKGQVYNGNLKVLVSNIGGAATNFSEGVRASVSYRSSIDSSGALYNIPAANSLKYISNLTAGQTNVEVLFPVTNFVFDSKVVRAEVWLDNAENGGAGFIEESNENNNNYIMILSDISLPTTTYSWSTSEWGDCINNIQTRTQTCSGTPETLCGTKPTISLSQSCTSTPTPTPTPTLTYSWHAGSWSTCANNSRARMVTCQQDNNGAGVADNLCTGTKPENSQSCVSETATYSWVVKCQDSSGNIVADNLCSGAKPTFGSQPSVPTPTIVIDYTLDTDSDVLTDYQESLFGTDAAKVDTEGDGYEDVQEIYFGYNPLTTSTIKTTNKIKIYGKLWLVTDGVRENALIKLKEEVKKLNNNVLPNKSVKVWDILANSFIYGGYTPAEVLDVLTKGTNSTAIHPTIEAATWRNRNGALDLSD